MFLKLKHKRFDIYNVAQQLILETYRKTDSFPPGEKYALTNQIRRAAVSVILNVSEGSSRKSITERKRFYEISRGSLIELDTALEICIKLEYCTKEELVILGEFVVRCFQMISKMLEAKE